MLFPIHQTHSLCMTGVDRIVRDTRLGILPESLALAMVDNLADRCDTLQTLSDDIETYNETGVML